MLSLVLGILILFYPLIQIPKMIQRKRTIGHYFSEDKRILVDKSENMGNNLHLQHKYGFYQSFCCVIFNRLWSLFNPALNDTI